MAKYILVCADCGVEFPATSAGARALYWHLKADEGYSREEAYTEVGVSRVEVGYDYESDFREMKKNGWEEI
jgi:hypothetical protein